VRNHNAILSRAGNFSPLKNYVTAFCIRPVFRGLQAWDKGKTFNGTGIVFTVGLNLDTGFLAAENNVAIGILTKYYNVSIAAGRYGGNGSLTGIAIPGTAAGNRRIVRIVNLGFDRGNTLSGTVDCGCF
jgi:hypothetical protein